MSIRLVNFPTAHLFPDAGTYPGTSAIVVDPGGGDPGTGGGGSTGGGGTGGGTPTFNPFDVGTSPGTYVVRYDR